MTIGQPHARYPHVYVVVRIDGSSDDRSDLDADVERLTATSVFTTEEAASADVERLNASAERRGIRSRYVMLMSRFKDR